MTWIRFLSRSNDYVIYSSGPRSLIYRIHNGQLMNQVINPQIQQSEGTITSNPHSPTAHVLTQANRQQSRMSLSLQSNQSESAPTILEHDVPGTNKPKDYALDDLTKIFLVPKDLQKQRSTREDTADVEISQRKRQCVRKVSITQYDRTVHGPSHSPKPVHTDATYLPFQTSLGTHQRQKQGWELVERSALDYPSEAPGWEQVEPDVLYPYEAPGWEQVEPDVLYPYEAPGWEQVEPDVLYPYEAPGWEQVEPDALYSYEAPECRTVTYEDTNSTIATSPQTTNSITMRTNYTSRLKSIQCNYYNTASYWPISVPKYEL
jgi:hypothetical protein